ncbi:MAG TPA: ATP-binding cassette domain-containing protein [Acholeplasmataceae bacterium]|jgi:sodium transport system ATP-binding protein|nr:ATP-binding cassette domain-containing protein [Acholeplasmataceae bacterium]
MIEAITVSNLSKTFTLSKKQMQLDNAKSKVKVAVDNLDFVAYKGEIFGLLGPNGAGKTTTLRCIATLIKPDRGKIVVDGIDIKNEVEVKKRIAFLTNELKLEDQFTPNYMFEYFSRFHEIDEETMKKRREELFSRFGVNKFAEVKIGELSTGMKQKVSLAVSLVHDPDIIIFDEPTTGLDVITAKTVTDYLLELKAKGKSIIISTHIMSLVTKLCDRVGIIFDGKMKICDSLDNILALSENRDLEEVFFDLYAETGGKL